MRPCCALPPLLLLLLFPLFHGVTLFDCQRRLVISEAVHDMVAAAPPSSDGACSQNDEVRGAATQAAGTVLAARAAFS